MPSATAWQLSASLQLLEIGASPDASGQDRCCARRAETPRQKVLGGSSACLPRRAKDRRSDAVTRVLLDLLALSGEGVVAVW